MAKTLLLEDAGADATGDAYPSFGGQAMIAFTGTFSGATSSVEISLDGVTWSVLHDASGEEISISAPIQDVFCETIRSEYSIRGVTTGGDGSTAVNVSIQQ